MHFLGLAGMPFVESQTTLIIMLFLNFICSLGSLLAALAQVFFFILVFLAFINDKDFNFKILKRNLLSLFCFYITYKNI